MVIVVGSLDPNLEWLVDAGLIPRPSSDIETLTPEDCYFPSRAEGIIGWPG
jgi:hypothetical protein